MNTIKCENRTLEVLLVEDNPGDADLILEKGEMEKHRPVNFHVCSTLARALPAIGKEPLDMILLDLNLPDSHGLQTFQKINEAAPDTPVVVLTGHDDLVMAAHCIELGAHDYLIKGHVEDFIINAIYNTVTRARTQRALFETHENIKHMVADNQDPILVLDSEHIVRFANKAAVLFFGNKVEVGREFGLPLTGLQPQELDISRDDGSVSTVEIRICDSIWYGEPARLVTFRDITARKQAEESRRERLENEKSRLVDIIENLPHGIIILNEKQEIVTMNSSAVYPLTSLNNVRQGDRLTHLGGTPLSKFMADSRNSEWKDQVSVVEEDTKVFEVIGRPVFSGPFTGGWLIALRDITEETIVAAKIQQQERLAAVGQLAAGIAHDFNNLLTSIGGYSEMIAGDKHVAGNIRERAEVIRTQVRRAAQLIRQILDFSRKSLSTRHPLELVSFMKESVKLLERTIKENIQIDMRYEAGNYIVSADPVGLQQVITNLAINAQDAMPNGGLLSINLDQVFLEQDNPKPLPDMPAGEYVELAVSDTGDGIHPKILNKIFDPFFTTKPVGKGTGLGLSQAIGIIHAHQGLIDVKSNLGVGTIFKIFLPILKMKEQQITQETVPAPARGRKEIILLVEDEDGVLKMGKEMLEDVGYQVITARDGREALELFLKNKKDVSLVLTDLVMPRMSGKDLITSLKSIDPQTKIIAWTGYPLEDEDKALQQNIIGWIMKPPELSELTRMIRQALDRG